ncbi:hypothetical protein DICVIV_13491, partial [Dictyocaulus viviparus]
GEATYAKLLDSSQSLVEFIKKEYQDTRRHWWKSNGNARKSYGEAESGFREVATLNIRASVTVSGCLSEDLAWRATLLPDYKLNQEKHLLSI